MATNNAIDIGVVAGGGNTYTFPSATDTLVGRASTDTLTNKDLTDSSNTFPTFNQNTTGSAATLTTARTLLTNLASTSSASFNGSANVVIGIENTLPVNHGGTGATTLTGLIKGNGTSAFTAATAGTDYQSPITLTTTGTSGAATFSSNTLNIPNYATAPGGSNKNLQYNNNGAFGGISNILWDGTGLVLNCGIYTTNIYGIMGTIPLLPDGVAVYSLGGCTSVGDYNVSFNITTGSYPNLTSDTDGSTITFDLNTSNTHTVTLGGNRTLALSNVNVGQCFMINLVQDSTGSRTVTFWSGIKWPGGTAPTLSTAANATDSFGFQCIASGSYLGFVMAQNM